MTIVVSNKAENTPKLDFYEVQEQFFMYKIHFLATPENTFLITSTPQRLQHFFLNK